MHVLNPEEKNNGIMKMYINGKETESNLIQPEKYKGKVLNIEVLLG